MLATCGSFDRYVNLISIGTRETFAYLKYIRSHNDEYMHRSTYLIDSIVVFRMIRVRLWW
jgi:hypothetical protein